MPVDQTQVLNIVCDNPDCPGNELDPTKRDGWTFISTEVYGQPVSEQKVYCCADCAGHVTQALRQEEMQSKLPPTLISDQADPGFESPTDNLKLGETQ